MNPLGAFEDDYLNCDEYKQFPVNDTINRVALFRHSNELYYFALYDENDQIKLRSEGFPSVESRQFELDLVLKLHSNPKMYSEFTKAGHIVRVLKDESGREIARSCFEKIPLQILPVKTNSSGMLRKIWHSIMNWLGISK